MDKLPKIGVHIELSTITVERVVNTGHPRLLGNVLKGINEDKPEAMLKDVHIGEVTGSVWEGYTEWTQE